MSMKGYTHQMLYIERSFDESTSDGFLSAPELRGVRYCIGYSSYWRPPNKYVCEEYRLTERYACCPKFEKKCRGVWHGFRFLDTKHPGRGPWALYQCKHGIGEVRLVSEIRDHQKLLAKKP